MAKQKQGNLPVIITSLRNAKTGERSWVVCSVTEGASVEFGQNRNDPIYIDGDETHTDDNSRYIRQTVFSAYNNPFARFRFTVDKDDRKIMDDDSLEGSVSDYHTVSASITPKCHNLLFGTSYSEARE